MGKRALHKKSAPGYWCPITGQIETGETEVAAVVREVWEEARLHVEAEHKIADFVTRDKTAHLHWWRVKLVGEAKETCNHENSELRWVTLAELRQLRPIFTEDLEVFERLVSGAL